MASFTVKIANPPSEAGLWTTIWYWDSQYQDSAFKDISVRSHKFSGVEEPGELRINLFDSDKNRLAYRDFNGGRQAKDITVDLKGSTNSSTWEIGAAFPWKWVGIGGGIAATFGAIWALTRKK